MKRLLSIVVALSFNLYAVASDEVDRFAQRMHAVHQFDKDTIKTMIETTPPREDVLRMYSNPATSAPFDQFEAWFINERRINNGVVFWIEHQDALERAEKQYGVPASVIVALLGVETSYGNNIGRHKVVEALITLGFHGPRRKEYFRSELEHFLVASRDLNWKENEIIGSFAGAIGIPQFMPSNIKQYAVDFDGDGIVDIVKNKTDAIGSVANYLKQMGWRRNEPIAVKVKGKNGHSHTFVLKTLPGPAPIRWKSGHNYRMIKRYNPSDNYAMTVFILSEKVKQRYKDGAYY